VLKELGFCVHIKHPHKLVVVYLQLFGSELFIVSFHPDPDPDPAFRLNTDPDPGPGL
jgi:hypothetical protein